MPSCYACLLAADDMRKALLAGLSLLYHNAAPTILIWRAAALHSCAQARQHLSWTLHTCRWTARCQ
jgi:hypothetical protein